MLEYWSFRFKVYNHSLKLWLENLKQTSIAVVALFPMAMPALVFMPFVFIGIIVKPDTSSVSFFNTLWGYLLLLYAWIRYQRKGILAQDYRHYLATLPVSKTSQILGDLAVTLYVANFFVLAPLFLCLYALANFAGNDQEAFQVIVSLGSLTSLSSYYCLASIKFRTPWLSLFGFPLLMTIVEPELAKYQYLGLWLVAILLDYLPRFRLDKVAFKPKGMAYLFFKWEQGYAENNKLILVVTLILLSLTKVITESVSLEVANYFVNFAAFLFGVVLAANLFSVQKCRTEHHAFLNSYPISEVAQQIAAVKYTLAKLLIALVVLLSAGIFAPYQWGLFGCFYGATMVGIIKWPKRFILLPIAVGSLVVAANIVLG